MLWLLQVRLMEKDGVTYELTVHSLLPYSCRSLNFQGDDMEGPLVSTWVMSEIGALMKEICAFIASDPESSP